MNFQRPDQKSSVSNPGKEIKPKSSTILVSTTDNNITLTKLNKCTVDYKIEMIRSSLEIIANPKSWTKLPALAQKADFDNTTEGSLRPTNNEDTSIISSKIVH